MLARVAAASAAAPSLASGVPRSGALAPPPAVASLIAAAPWRGGLEPCGDYEAEARVTSGALPSALRGTLYRLGPGRLRLGEHRYGHWFDGDGQLTALRLGDDGCRCATRLLRTSRVAAQEAAGDSAGFAVRGAWTQAHGWWRNLLHVPTNPSNTAPLVWAGKLLALCEGGPPLEADTASLATLSEARGWLGSPLGLGFGAHFKLDDGLLYDCSIQLPSGLRVFALDNTGKEVRAAVLPLPELAMVHDFSQTAGHLVFLIPPWTCEGGAKLAALTGLTAFGHAFSWKEGRGTRLLVVRKADFSIALDTFMEPFSLYHFGNAWESEAGDGGVAVHVQVCKLIGSRDALERNFSDMYSASLGRESFNDLWQLDVDLQAAATGAEGAVSFHPALAGAAGSPQPLPMEFPVFNPLVAGRRHRYTYAAAKAGDEPSYFNALQKYDFEKGVLATRLYPPGEYASECNFVPRPGGAEEDDGYLLALVYIAASHSTRLDVLDARDVGGPPLATCSLPAGSHIPYTFHGFWQPAAADVA